MLDVKKTLVRVRVNGEMREAQVEPRTLLVDFLREHLNLTGTHVGCDTTYCGACTVLLNGRTVKSCTLSKHFQVHSHGRGKGEAVGDGNQARW